MTIDLPTFRPATEVALAQALGEAAERVIRSGRFALGVEVESFEREFAHHCGSTHCVGVANGTDALELALRAVGVSAGDRVVTVANAGYYASTAVRAIGALPVYVDVDDTLLAPPSAIERVQQGARAIVVTHLYGRLARVGEIVERARRAGIAVIEDCAHAHGAIREGAHAGTFGAAGCFSFYPTKNLGALGDGGAVLTSDAALDARLRSLRQFGWSAKYQVAAAGGRNSRLDEMQAAFLRTKLPYLARWNAARVAIAERYRDGLRGLPLQVPQWREGEYVAHLFVVRCGDRDALRSHLALRGIGTDVHYPVSDHAQATEASSAHPPLPVTQAACRDVLTLPCFPGMTDDEVDRVVESIQEHYAGHHD